MNVLSLFDGMSCGQIALNRAGFKIDNYFACEIDKYAIQVTQANYPNTQQLGDVTKVSALDLPALDLVIGGSPCQGFSFAGKQLNFEDPRSKLFFEFVRLLKEARVKNPDVKFLLENVKMKKEYQDVISSYLEVEPIEINSALVSAQNRKRLYWTNLEGVEQPKDKGIMLKAIIHEKGVVDKDKSYCIDAHYAKGGNLKQYFEKSRRQLVFKDCEGLDLESFIKDDTWTEAQIYAPSITDGVMTLSPRSSKGLQTYQQDRCYAISGKMTNLSAELGRFIVEVPSLYFRKLTPIECERLQTVPDNYTAHVSNSQRYKMLGNGWTVDVINHILQSDISL